MKTPTRYGNPNGDPEILDNTPIEMPLGYCRPTPLQDLIANMVREAVQVEKNDEYESFEDSNDFEEENPDVLDLSPYTLTDIPDEEIEPPQPAPQQVEQELASDLNQTGDPPDQNAAETGKP